MFALPLSMSGQDITSSPYSRFGYGQLNSSVPTALKSMGGTAIGVQRSDVINFVNPAAYAASDSLSFIMDMGVSANWTQYGDGDVSKSSFLGNLDYLAMQFSLLKDRLIVSGGIIPFSTAGYGLKNLVRIEGGDEGRDILRQDYKGSGSIQSIYAGLGAKVYKGLSLGFNVKYTFGALSHTLQVVPGSALFSKTLTTSTIGVRALSFDLGAQYRWRYAKEDYVVFGLTCSPAAKMTPELTLVKNKNLGSLIQPDLTTEVSRPETELPLKVGGGLSWGKGNKLLIATDVQWTRWGSVSNVFDGDGVKVKDAYRVTLGAQYLKDTYSRDYLDRVIYSGGLNYETSYTDLPVVGRVDRLSATAGVGLPVTPYGERTSYIHVSLEYVKGLPSGGHKVFSEDMVRVSLGFNFNETWFKKLKIY